MSSAGSDTIGWEQEPASGDTLAGIPLPSTPPPGPDYALVYNGTAFEWRDTGQEILLGSLGYAGLGVNWFVNEFIGLNCLAASFADPVTCKAYAEVGEADYKRFLVTYDYATDNTGNINIIKYAGGTFSDTGIAIPISAGVTTATNDVDTLTLQKGEMIVFKLVGFPVSFYAGKLHIFALRYPKTKG